jgi:hypothetical protein
MVWVLIGINVVVFVAWAVSLNAFPYLAVPAYWILGRSRFRLTAPVQ